MAHVSAKMDNVELYTALIGGAAQGECCLQQRKHSGVLAALYDHARLKSHLRATDKTRERRPASPRWPISELLFDPWNHHASHSIPKMDSAWDCRSSAQSFVCGSTDYN